MEKRVSRRGSGTADSEIHFRQRTKCSGQRVVVVAGRRKFAVVFPLELSSFFFASSSSMELLTTNLAGEALRLIQKEEVSGNSHHNGNAPFFRKVELAGVFTLCVQAVCLVGPTFTVFFFLFLTCLNCLLSIFRFVELLTCMQWLRDRG